MKTTLPVIIACIASAMLNLLNAELPPGDYQMITVPEKSDSDKDVFPVAENVKIKDTGNGKFAILFSKPPINIYYNKDYSETSEKECVITEGKGGIQFQSSIIQATNGIMTRIYSGLIDPETKTVKGTVYHIGVTGGSKVGVFTIIPKEIK